MDTPPAITAFDQAAMERMNVKNIKDISNLVPNLDSTQDKGQSTPIISMGGVRSTNSTELGDPPVGVHIDGVYTPRMQGALALIFDTERVEVLRGPQETLPLTGKPNPYYSDYQQHNTAINHVDAAQTGIRARRYPRNRQAFHFVGGGYTAGQTAANQGDDGQYE